MRIDRINAFSIGANYTHQEIYQSLGVGNAGGIRPALNPNGSLRRVVILTTAPSAKIAAENPYSDRMEGDVLVYTAAGREGSQILSGINSRIANQSENSFPIYCFRNTAHRRSKNATLRRWEFLGVFLHQRHFQEMQVDSQSVLRNAWVFELRRLPTDKLVPVELDQQLFEKVVSDARFEKSFDNSPVVASTAAPDMLGLEERRRKMLAMSPQEFEHFIKEALVLSGFEQVMVTPYSQDGGIDVEATISGRLWTLEGTILQVQVKRWIHTVGRREVAELRGSMKSFARGALVTTSHYSKSAVLESKMATKLPIVLINGLQFAEITKRLGLLR